MGHSAELNSLCPAVGHSELTFVLCPTPPVSSQVQPSLIDSFLDTVNLPLHCVLNSNRGKKHKHRRTGYTIWAHAIWDLCVGNDNHRMNIDLRLLQVTVRKNKQHGCLVQLFSFPSQPCVDVCTTGYTNFISPLIKRVFELKRAYFSY